MERRFKALILNDYPGAHYADDIKYGRKTIETRDRAFRHRGDLVICCGQTNSVGNNAGNALCIVDLWKIREMRKGDEDAAGVRYRHGIQSYLLRNWRHFSRDFKFAPQKTNGAWQSIFEIILPDDVEIIERPGIIPFDEMD